MRSPWMWTWLWVLLLWTAGASALDAGLEQDMSADMGPAEEELLATEADLELERDLRNAYRQIEVLQDVRPTVLARVVTLQGEVGTNKARDRAEALARKLSGVLEVENRLSVREVNREERPAVDEDSQRTAQDEAIQDNIHAIFAQIETLKGVRAQVNAGVVQLDGKVRTAESRRQAEELARKIGGVIFVYNAIQETTDVTERVSPAIEKIHDLGTGFVGLLPLFLVALLILIFFWYLGKLVSRFLVTRKRFEQSPLVLGLVRQGLRIGIFLLGVLIVLEIFDVTTIVGAVFGTAGLAGLAIGFAFKDIVENYLASILLSVRQPFAKNDLVEIDGRYRGRVVRLTTRETVLMTVDGNHVRVPNAVVFKSVMFNFTRNPNRRFDFAVGFANETELTEAMQLGLDVLRSTDGVLEQPGPFALIEELGDSTVNARFFAWVDQREVGLSRAKSEAIRKVKMAFDEAGIDMPEPAHRILMKDVSAAPDEKQPIREVDLSAPAYQTGIFTAVAEDEDRQLAAQIEAERESSDEADLLDS